VTHFAAVGLPVAEPADLPALLECVFAESGQEPRSGAHTLSWRDLSGGGVDVLVDPLHPDGGCVTPQFDGESRHTVRLTRVVDDPEGCPGCTMVVVDVLRDGELLYPLVLAPARAAALTAGWRREVAAASAAPERPASLTFVAEFLQRWPDEDAFRAAPDADPAAWGSRSVVPVGPFTPTGPPQPYVVAHGHVTRAERRPSATFDTAFWHVRLSSYGGEYDVVIAEEEVPAQSPLRPGEVLRVRAWVCGRLYPPVGALGEQEEEARWARFLAGSEPQVAGPSPARRWRPSRRRSG